jgi:hypothetical protein
VLRTLTLASIGVALTALALLGSPADPAGGPATAAVGTAR